MITFTAIGRLTADAAITMTQDGKAIAKFTLACNSVKKKNGDKWESETTFADCVFFNAGNMTSFLQKGRKFAVTGTIKQENWESKDGTKRKALKFNVNSIEFCESKSAESAETPSAEYSVKKQEVQSAKTPDEFCEEVPF